MTRSGPTCSRRPRTPSWSSSMPGTWSATCRSRIACRDLGLPVVVAANLTDEAAKRGITVDTGRLGQLLNAAGPRDLWANG